MKLNEQSHNAIASALREAVSRYKGIDEENFVVTDIHLQPNQDSGEFIVFNDDDEELSHAIVNEWIEYDGDDFYKEVQPALSVVLNELKEEGTFDQLGLVKPYSFVLVDDEKETIADLLLMDDDETLLLDDELLKGLDEELDAFLKDLLEK